AAHDDPGDAGIEQRPVTDTATGLDGHADGERDGHDDVAVAAVPLGRVEVDDVDPGRTRGLELLRDRDRIVAVHRFVGEVALPQSHDATVTNVDRRIQIHSSPPSLAVLARKCVHSWYGFARQKQWVERHA